MQERYIRPEEPVVCSSLLEAYMQMIDDLSTFEGKELWQI